MLCFFCLVSLIGLRFRWAQYSAGVWLRCSVRTVIGSVRYIWDIETSGLDPWDHGAQLICSVAVRSDGRGMMTDVAQQATILADPGNEVVGHNIVAFDIPWWEAHVGPVRCRLYDTRIAHSLIDENAPNSLAYLVEKYLDETVHDFKELRGGFRIDENGQRVRYSLLDFPLEDVVEYCERDVDQTMRVYRELDQDLCAAGQDTLFHWLMDRSRCVTSMIGKGVRLDTAWVARQEGPIRAEVEATEARMRVFPPDLFTRTVRVRPPKGTPRGRWPTQQVPRQPNFDSGRDLRTILYDTWRLPVLGRTTSGDCSTNKSTLKKLRSYVGSGPAREWLQDLLNYRRLGKMLGTYLLPLRDRHLGVDGRVHTSYYMGRGADRGKEGQGGTRTGRLSSSKPNLQNVPRDPRIKGAFIPTEGYVFDDADYSQLELRIAAWYAGETVMLDAFAENRDIHTFTLALMKRVSYEVAVERVESGEWKDERALVKPVNFGILYGVAASTLQDILLDLNIDMNLWRCSEIIENWKSTYPAVTSWIKETKARVRRDGYVTTPTGRVRHLKDGHSANGYQVYRAERQGVNYLVQSFAADIVLQGINNLYDAGTQLVLTVHDSVLMERKEGTNNQQLEQRVTWMMTDQVNQQLKTIFDISKLPLAVDIKTSLTRWGE